jgi:sugar (pentulose or hexulose) kinase
MTAMAAPARVLVLDIGKTNVKAALVDTGTLAEIDRRTIANAVLPGPPYPHADADRIQAFLLDALRDLNARYRIDAIVTTAHAATAALVDRDGGLALPILDYEHSGPDELAAEYDASRPDFAETGSPRLGRGLNLGAQLYWQFRRFPDAAARTAAILLYPQYWAFRLSGAAASEVTSLGAHTDLWCPAERRLSSLVDRLGWRDRFPQIARAHEVLGPVTPALAAATGLDPATPVFCGIHDSNASLLPHLLARSAPFAVVSTGTWVISMAVGGRPVTLDPRRDTLVNVDAFGTPVPSARFMGGREFARMTGGDPVPPAPADIAAVLGRGIMLLPAVEPGSGPFQGRAHRWTIPEADLTDGRRAAAVSFYLALMTAVCLEMIGAEGPSLVEGPFAGNAAFRAMLGAASGRPVIAATGGGSGTSAGAALLTRADAGAARPAPAPPSSPAAPGDPALAAYAAAWHDRT